MRSATIASLLILANACGSGTSEDRAAVPAASPTQANAASLVHLSDSSAAQLGRDVDDAEQRGLWLDVKRKWSAQPVSWTVYRHPALCRSEAACNVRAFGIDGAKPGAQHGWLPRLEWVPGQFEAMVARCGAAPTCELAIEGRIGTLELSPEQPTSVTLVDVRLAPAKLAQR